VKLCHIIRSGPVFLRYSVYSVFVHFTANTLCVSFLDLNDL